MENIKLINKRLLEEYGTGIFISKTQETIPDARPKFRVVWADEQYEIRKGTFNIFSGGIFLRTEIGIKKVRKYSYINERWILEKLVYAPTEELPESEKGHYEIVWNFESKDGKYLKPIWIAIDLLVKTLLGRSKWHRGQKEINADEAAKFRKEIEEFEEQLDISTPLQTQFRHGEAVIIHRDNEK